MPVSSKDAELIKKIYEDMDFNLINRRMVPIGVEGIAVIYDDPDRKEGLAVVRSNKVDLVVKVSLRDGRYYDENGEEVTLRGWVHSVLRNKKTDVNSEFVPPKNEKTSL